MKKWFSCIFIIILLFLGVTFAVLNAQLVTINYYIDTNQLPLSLLLVIILGIGIFIGWLTGLVIWLRSKTENIRLSHQLKIAQKELVQLRTSPLNELV